MMKARILMFVFCGVFCTSCAAQTGRAVAVRVPVVVPCRMAVVDHPVWPTQDLPMNASLFQKVRALLAENELRKAYELRLLTEMGRCGDGGG